MPSQFLLGGFGGRGFNLHYGFVLGSEIRVWSGGAVTPVMNVLVPQFEQQTSHKVRSRIMTARQRLAAGERGEMAIAALN